MIADEKSLLGSDLQLPLTLAESQLILEALVEKPFKQVFELIGSLNHQAQQFYTDAAMANKNQRQIFLLSSAEFYGCVTALGDLPYNRVQALLAHMHEHLQAQSGKMTGGRHE